jgi:hypothetical protein
MKPILTFTAATLMILAGAAVFRPHKMIAGPDSAATVNPAATPAAIAGQKMRLAENYGKLPLSFEANQGQTDSRVRFLSRGRGYSLFLTGDAAVLTLERASQNAKRKSQNAKVEASVAPRFIGAALPVGASSAGTRPNAVRPYNLPTLFSLAGPMSGSDNELEKPRDRRAGPALQSSRMADGGESSAVLRMRLVGANAKAAVTGADELPGKSNYFIGNDPKKWRTNVPNYAKVKYQNVYPGVDLVYYGNRSGQLEYDFVVAPGADPGVIAMDVAAGLSRHADVAAGLSRHSDVGAGLVPAHEGHPQGVPLRIAADGDLLVKTDGGEVRFHRPVVYQPAINKAQRTTDKGQRASVDGEYVLQANSQVGFRVASYDHSKPLFIDPALSYSTYLGGSNWDQAYAIAVDSSGNAYVTGYTVSSDFPTENPIQATCDGCNPSTNNSDAFVAKLDATGSSLVYSTYLGGNGQDFGDGIAVDSSGNAYVTGYTSSTDFPTANPLQASLGGSAAQNAFVSKLNAAGSALVYSTYLGGSHHDTGTGIAVDSSGDAYLTGTTSSTDFPTTPGAFQTIPQGAGSFVAKLNAAGSALDYSTFLGPSSPAGIAVDSSGNAYVTGGTDSGDFPTVNPLQATNHGGLSDAFVSELNAAGSALVYSTYLGGSGFDFGYGIAVDSSGNAYITGATISTDFPTVSPYQGICGGCYKGDGDAFVAKLNAGGSALVYSTYLGGSNNDGGSGIAVDPSGNAYLTGFTTSYDFPTINPIQATCGSCGGYSTAFVARLNSAGSGLTYSTYLGGSSNDFGQGIALDSYGSAYVTGATFSSDFPTVNALQPTNHGGYDAFVAKISLTDGVPSVSLSPVGLTFEPQDVGATSGSQRVTLTNPGNGALNVTSIVASGDFDQTNNCGTSVRAGGGNCTISVTFTPTAILTRTGAITITDNAPNSPQTITLSGLGLLPVVCLPNSLIFPSTVEFTTSHTQTVTCTNTLNTNVKFSRITTNLSDFGVTNSGTCSTSSPLLPGGHCTIVVTFTPSSVGLEEGTLTITDSANSQSVSLSARGNP